MKQIVGTSKNYNVKDASKNIQSPNLLILFCSDKAKFQQCVEELEAIFPKVPSIACVTQSYGQTEVCEQGITVVGLIGVSAIANILTDVSTMPMKRIQQFEQDMNSIGGDEQHTVCLDYCTSNDECVLSSMMTILKKKRIQLSGGTCWDGVVACNGKVYEDACVYVFIKSSGKVRVYRENLYEVTDKKFVVTKSIPEKNVISELNGEAFNSVYCRELGISESSMAEQTFQNPLGRLVNNNIYIVSLKENAGNGSFACYRKVYTKDVIYILELGDMEGIINNTIDSIKRECKSISGIISVNCIYRYLLFKKKNNISSYLGSMSRLGSHAGIIGAGEHFNGQYVNQTFSGIVFE